VQLFHLLKTDIFKLKQFTTIERCFHSPCYYEVDAWHCISCDNLLKEALQLIRDTWRQYFKSLSIRCLWYLALIIFNWEKASSQRKLIQKMLPNEELLIEL